LPAHFHPIGWGLTVAVAGLASQSAPYPSPDDRTAYQVLASKGVFVQALINLYNRYHFFTICLYEIRMLIFADKRRKKTGKIIKIFELN